MGGVACLPGLACLRVDAGQSRWARVAPPATPAKGCAGQGCAPSWGPGCAPAVCSRGDQRSPAGHTSRVLLCLGLPHQFWGNGSAASRAVGGEDGIKRAENLQQWPRPEAGSGTRAQVTVTITCTPGPRPALVLEGGHGAALGGAGTSCGLRQRCQEALMGPPIPLRLGQGEPHPSLGTASPVQQTDPNPGALCSVPTQWGHVGMGGSGADLRPVRN